VASATLLATPASARADEAPPPAAAPPAPATTAATTTATATATTTAAAATTATTTAAAEPTTTVAPAAPAPARAAGATLAAVPAPAPGCVKVGAIGVLRPRRPALVLASARSLAAARLVYPASGAILRSAGLTVDVACDPARPATGTARLRLVSLFGGAVTADALTLGLGGAKGAIVGLHANGRPVSLAAGRRTPLGDWGYLEPPAPQLGASLFRVVLVRPHAGLPAGTVVLVPYAGVKLAPVPAPAPAAVGAAPAPPRERPPRPRAFASPPAAPPARAARPRRHLPLTVTPPLRGGPYVFPVAGGEVAFGDGYGAPRADVAGGWHHGDDLFAPLGTPVVAVADGTLNRVGWEKLGGWRLWVRDREGDEFYYAHLAGYSTLALRDRRVRAGEVIGFVGDTGDAFATEPHLHFEIHPRGLLHLRYDGAVDPTPYLGRWRRTDPVRVPPPAHPPFPRAAIPRHEARVDFRALLAARRLDRPRRAPAPPSPPPAPPRPRPAAAAPAPARAGASALRWAAGAGILAALLLGALTFRLTPGGARGSAAGRRPGSGPTPPRTP